MTYRFSFSLLLLLLWLLMSYGYAGDTHIERSRDCFSCHEEFDHDTFESMADEVCGKCHRGALTKKRAMEALELEQNPLPSVDDRSDVPGMVLPFTAAKSLRGDGPNKMVEIAAGDFTMGTDNRLPDEGPSHQLYLPTFYIDVFEVTNLQYQRFIQEKNHRSPAHFRNRTYPQGYADHPVNFVSWNDAKAYCAWADKRLPSNAEWEKAARGIDQRTYPWGDKFSIERANTSMLWKTIKREGNTTPVGAFPAGASPYGVHDMSGNVWEWTSSLYERYPGNDTPAETYLSNYRTLKGGSWWDCSFYQCGISAPVFNRSFFSPNMRNETIGFRCAKDAKENP